MSDVGIPTTHSGSLPRLVGKSSGNDLFAPESGEQAVEFAVRRQLALGIDIVNDGEITRPGYVSYLAARLIGLSATQGRRLPSPDLDEFPGFTPRFTGTPAPRPSGHRCTGPVGYVGQAALYTDIVRLTGLLDGAAGFLTVPSPATVALFVRDEHYRDRRAYLDALADALRVEYAAILDAGLALQIDCPDLGIDGTGRSPAELRHRIKGNIAALNRGLDGLPGAIDRTRLHLCWGNYEGPHHFDVPLDRLVDLVADALPATIAFETANPRHGHEDAAWARLARAGKRLAPGVIDSTTNYIEHPELVAKRLRGVMAAADTDDILATTDCGFGCVAHRYLVDPRIAWAKLGALAEGAALIT